MSRAARNWKQPLEEYADPHLFSVKNTLTHNVVPIYKIGGTMRFSIGGLELNDKARFKSSRRGKVK